MICTGHRLRHADAGRAAVAIPDDDGNPLNDKVAGEICSARQPASCRGTQAAGNSTGW